MKISKEEAKELLNEYLEHMELNHNIFIGKSEMNEFIDIKFNNSAQDEALSVQHNEAERQVSLTCNCTWPQCNHLSNCREVNHKLST